MNHWLTVRFLPTQQDYVRVSRMLLFRGWRIWVALGTMAVVELCLLLALPNHTFTSSTFAWPIAFFLPGVFFWLFVGLPYRTGQISKGNEMLLAEITWEFGEDQVVVKNPYQETKYDWSSFRSLTENSDYFFLRHTASKQQYQFLPKRAFADPEQQSQFRDLVRRKIAAHKGSGVGDSHSDHLVTAIVLIPVIGMICILAIGAALYVGFARDTGRWPISPHGTPTVSPSADSSSYVDQARAKAFMKQYREAIPLLDQAIQLDPRNGYVYYLRAYSYSRVAADEHIYELHQQELGQARQDIDHAIEYGVSDPNFLSGELYFLRYQIYSISHAASDADVVAMQPILRENLRMAEALGTNDKYINQYIVFTYFDQHDCQGGLAELQRIREKSGLSAPPSSSLYNIEGHGYACQGEYDKALESIDKGLNIESFPERLYFRAVILYYLGSTQEAFNTLNGLIATEPEFHAERYYFRSLIQYDLGDPQSALADLDAGDRYSWDRGGVGAYLRGRMAYDKHDVAQAGKQFQLAYLTLGWLYNPVRSDAADKLAALGQATPVSTPSWVYRPTSMPPSRPLPTPDFPLAVNGIQLPPSPTAVSMDRGTGNFDVSGVNAYPVILFQASHPIEIESVQALTIHIIPVGDPVTAKFEIFIWNPSTGAWTMFKQGWQDIAVSDPSEYVAHNGDVYLAVRTDSGAEIFIKHLWLTVQYTAADSSRGTLDLVP